MPEEKIHSLEINMAELKTDIKYIKEGLDDNKNQHKEILDRIDENTTIMNGFIQSSTDRFVDKKYHNETICEIRKVVETMDDKYAPKIAWKVIVWGARIIGMATILGFLGLIYKMIILLGNNVR